MKKSLSLMWVIALSLVFSNIVNAQLSISELFSWKEALNAGSYAKLLNEYDNNWWYSSFDVIEWQMTEEGLSIKSPVVVDEDVSVVEEYRLIISPYRINALKTLNSGVDLSNITMKNTRLEAGSSEVTFNISVEDDNINPEIWYYGVIVPLDMYDIVWTPSKELCFQLSSNMYRRDSACDDLQQTTNPAPIENTPEDNAITTSENTLEDNTITPIENTPEDNVMTTQDNPENTWEHWAACVWMDLANVSHTVKGDELTLTWTAIDGNTVQVAVFDPEDEVYKSLGAVNMNDEKFVYKMQWNGEQNFMLTNGCKEVFYKADASIKTKPTIVPAATGPAENVLYILIASIILYGSYVVFFRKSDNK